jgi:hypothetical protein
VWLPPCRKKGVVLTQLAQAVVIAVLIGCVFMQIGTSQASAVRRQPVLFFCVINQGIFAALVSQRGSTDALQCMACVLQAITAATVFWMLILAALNWTFKCGPHCMWCR